MVEQAVQTVPAENAAEKIAQSAPQQQGRDSGRLSQHSGRDGPPSQRTASSGKLRQPGSGLLVQRGT